MCSYLSHKLLSLGRRRGFGVQSPTDYALIRYVLCESWPYYAYGDLRSYCRECGRGRRAHRLGCLLFRVANYVQAYGVYVATTADDFFLHYIHAGCHATERTADVADAQLVVADSLNMPLTVSRPAVSRRLFAKGTIIVVTGIHQSDAAETAWQKLVSMPGVGTTFDLYDAGVALTDTERHPHHYLV